MKFERGFTKDSPHQIEDLTDISTELLQEVYMTYTKHCTDTMFAERVRKELITRDNKAMLEVGYNTEKVVDNSISPDESFHFN
jgi:hypothetical protein